MQDLYHILRKGPCQTVITAAEQVQVGEPIEVLLHKGRLACEVTQVDRQGPFSRTPAR